MSEYTSLSLKPLTKLKLEAICSHKQTWDELLLELVELKENSDLGAKS